MTNEQITRNAKKQTGYLHSSDFLQTWVSTACGLPVNQPPSTLKNKLPS
jgi:hypothetical protein